MCINSTKEAFDLGFKAQITSAPRGLDGYHRQESMTPMMRTVSITTLAAAPMLIGRASRL